MSVLFREYELLVSSKLFDAEYYLRNNPEVAELNFDPVLHYLEEGAGKVLNPSANFDSVYYLEQCRRLGETPANPLLHYLTVGAAQGLRPVPTAEVQAASTERVSDESVVSTAARGLAISVDRAVLVRTALGKARLAIEGWAIADVPVARISATCEGRALGDATIGLARPDVAAAYPGDLAAMNPGFALIAEIDEPQGTQLSLDFLLATQDRTESRRTLRVDIDTVAEAAAADAPEAPVPAERTRVHHKIAPMRIHIDEAIVDEDGILTLSGWAVCCIDIASVDVFIDGEQIGRADYGRAREDVAAARKDYPGASRSGFGFNADLNRFGAGERMLKVQAVATSGIRRQAFVQVLVPRPNEFRADKVFHFHCDVVSLSASGLVRIEGWLVAGTVTESITVLLDGANIGRATLGRERLDVAKAHPGIAYARNSGFLFHEAQGSAVEPGEHLIVLRARDAGGDERDIPLPVHVSDEPAPEAAAQTVKIEHQAEIAFSLDAPKVKDGAADAPIIGSLSINGWALAHAGVAAVSIAIDGTVVANAQHGMRRDDVAAAFPDRPDAQQSGFATLIPYWLLEKGSHVVTVSVRDVTDRTASVEFKIDVEDVPEGEGPWSLRRKMSQAEIELNLAVLAGTRWRPWFTVMVASGSDDASLAQARATLATLESQAYPHWGLWVVARHGKAPSSAWRKALLAGFESVSERVKFDPSRASSAFARAARKRSGRFDTVMFMPLSAGDELGCDALLEMALASGLKRGCDLFYGDERCRSAVTDTVQAYFKPAWSPDLLMSTNYVGRPWCVDARLLERAGMSLEQWLEHGDYDFVLRATEAAQGVGHVAKVLCQRGPAPPDTNALERQALARALSRRNIRAAVKPGCARGFYRIQPKKARYGRVSIIIPTRASRGLIKACLDSLKSKTAYPDYEIICIENIPADQPDWKAWLRQSADTVLETEEPFNWSRYNNLCAQQATGKFLLFLNDDIEILDPEWLETMLHNAARPEVGIVGPQLLYPDRSVQHAGLALTHVQGRARHVFRHGREDDPGYFGLALAQRNVIAVTGACMLMRRETFDALGGFDEAYNVINNDLDFCLRAWKRGLLIVYTPHAQLIHHERISRTELGEAFDSAAFDAAWHDVFVDGDPYLNKNISRGADDLNPEREPVTTICAGHPLFARAAIRRILVVKLDHIGDCITSLPAIRKLKRHFPSAHITVLSGSATKLVWSLEPSVDAVLEFNFFHARSQLGMVGVTEQELLALGSQLKPLRFDLAVDLRKSPDTRHVLQHAGAKYLAGYDHESRFPWLDVALQWEGDPGRQSKRQSIGDDLVRLVDAISASADNERKRLDLRLGPLAALSEAEREGLSERPLVCIHAGAGNELKAWPLNSFCELIDLLVERDGVQVAMVGGPAEAELSDQVIAGVRDPTRVRNLAGKLKLNALPDLLLRASLFIGNDSGPKHIAAALGVPTVGIHSGNIDAREWGPVGPHAAAIWRQTSCSPCYIDKAQHCPRDLACLKGIGAGEVYRLCAKMLKIGAPCTGGPSIGAPGNGAPRAGSVGVKASKRRRPTAHKAVR